MHHTVLLFTGHLLDSIDRISARFPYRLVSEIRRLIAVEIARFKNDRQQQVAISSLAAGADILFAEEVLAAGLPLEVFLPFSVQEFIDHSVSYAKNHPEEHSDEWIERFRNCLARVSALHITQMAEGINPYAACNRAMLLRAMEAANQQKRLIHALAMMEKSSEVVEGGAASFADEIELTGIEVKRLWPYRPHRLYR